MSRVVLVKLR